MADKNIFSMCSGCKKPFVDGVCAENPILRQVLGICSCLAVTGFVSTAVVMGLALVLTTSVSALMISLIRNLIPNRVRLIIQMLLISVLVIFIHLFLRAYYFDMSKALGPYVGLIITNCVLLGRCEAYAMRNKPLPSFFDGLGNGAGYALILLIIALIREPLGSGTLLGYRVMPADFMPVAMIGSAPGAFMVMGILILIVRSIWPEKPITEEHPEADDDWE